MNINKKRLIVIVIGNYKNGGIAKQAAMMANGFARFGHMVDIVATKGQSDKPFFKLTDHVSIIPLDKNEMSNTTIVSQKDILKIKLIKNFCGVLPRKSIIRKRLNYAVAKQKQTYTLKKAMQKYDNPIIVPLGLEYAIMSFFASTGMKSDIIYATKTYAEGEMYGLDSEIALNIVKKLTCVVAQTEYTAEYFKREGIKNVTVIGNPLYVQTVPYEGTRNSSIVNFCRISREKRLELLIDAFAVFHKDYPCYHVDIYGNIVSQFEEEYKKELLAHIEELGLTEDIRIHPARKDIHETVKDAAMFVSTSDFEGLSNSMIEAMALGIPCICTDCDGGGAREYIENEVNGLLIPKDNVEALTEALYKFSDRDFAQACGKKATEIRRTLDINKIISEWENVINEYCS